ncbi:Ig-like domain-containing protein [uncultured Draconibacterium sp.]|uniref:Ig-like domain-containing protein n=1 Tax=uncultured Draconibacterium sp. TaxID=1573823 RepID=UPI0025CE7DF9|nr:Ig-like domain-containing protein [uncultured Draconibacterium sp.]
MKLISLLSAVIFLGNLVSLNAVGQSVTFSIDCSGLSATVIECDEELPSYSNLEEFIAAGGAYSSTYDIDTFGFSDISDGNTCPETITRSYFIINTNGDTASCSLQYVIQDITAPLLILPDKYCSCCNTFPVYSSVSDVLEYQAEGNAITDNCSLDSTIKIALLSQITIDSEDLIIYERTYQLSDRCGNTATAVEYIYVHHNTAPNVQNDSATTNINTAIDIVVTANDYDLKSNLNLESLNVLTGPSHGNVLINTQTGTITYTPDEDYVGPDIFRYTICDDGIPCMPECAEAIVFITVQGDVNTAVALEEIATGSEFTIYPNPNNGRFKIKLKETQSKAQLRIVDSMGQLIRKMSIEPSESKIIDVDLSDCTAGTYTVVLTQNDQRISKPIVIK